MVRRMIVVVGIFALVLALPLFAGGQSEAADAPEVESSETEEAPAEDLTGTPQDPDLFRPGRLTVATGEPVFPPWMMDDDPAGGVGFENGVVYALAAEMGFDRSQVDWVRVGFDEGIAPGPKDYDFNIQQFSITEAREQFVDFSIPYYQPDKAVVALPDSSVADATSFADLREARWGATIGTTDLDYIENVIGVSDVAVYDDQVGTFQALLAEQIDATTIGLPTALFVTAVQVPESKIVAVLPPDENDLGLGLVFSEGSSLVPWVNEALEAILADGTVDALVSEYLIGDDAIQEITE
jgi:polar amino acid transport system substrate-binding protein